MPTKFKNEYKIQEYLFHVGFNITDSISYLSYFPTNKSIKVIYINIKSEMRSFKSIENIHKKEGGSYYVVSANKASSKATVKQNCN